MAITITVNHDTCGDAWNNPRNIDHIDIMSDDGTEEAYYYDESGWYMFGTDLYDQDITDREMTYILIATLARGEQSNINIVIS